MFEKIKNYKIIFIKDNGLKVQEFKSKDFIFPGIILFGLISFLISLTFFSKDIKDIITLRTISKHNQNNRELNALILNQQDKIDTLLKEIQNIYKNDENLRKLIKLPSIDEDIRKLGVGGNEGKEKFNKLEYLLPNSFDLDKLNGAANIKASYGVITKLDKDTQDKVGFGKVLSILSLQTLPRRLTLDFSDLSNKGFSFDKLSAVLKEKGYDVCNRSVIFNNTLSPT